MAAVTSQKVGEDGGVAGGGAAAHPLSQVIKMLRDAHKNADLSQSRG